MKLRHLLMRGGVVVLALSTFSKAGFGQSSSSPSSGSSKPSKHAAPVNSGLDSGSVSSGIYRNKTLGLTLKIPEGWVLRTDEMNTPDEVVPSPKSGAGPAPSAGARVLLAAFSRPPDAPGEEVNNSIVIAAERISAYPGLTEPAQYFGPLTEVSTARGFSADEVPYEIAIGTTKLERGDFHKDVGKLVMRQSTLVVLSHGYAVSITVIGGTEDEVEELIDRLDFQGAVAKSPK